MPEASHQTVERLIEGLNTRDLALYHAQFHEDSVMEYPQPGERMVAPWVELAGD